MPGAIGRIIELHATYYSQNWNFDLFFEARVASELSAFLNRFDGERDGFWIARMNEEIVGSLAVDGIEGATKGGRLRWFIVDPRHQGCGIGKMLLQKAIRFCQNVGFRRLYLTTFVGLQAARGLYEAHGFTLCEEREGDHWGRTMREQTFELVL